LFFVMMWETLLFEPFALPKMVKSPGTIASSNNARIWLKHLWQKRQQTYIMPRPRLVIIMP
jgi:hypothetical protein